MWTDPVVEEIHQIRQKMLADSGGNAHALMQKFRDHQAASERLVVGSVRRRTLTANEGKLPSTTDSPLTFAATKSH